jgi:hypothetical protein
VYRFCPPHWPGKAFAAPEASLEETAARPMTDWVEHRSAGRRIVVSNEFWQPYTRYSGNSSDTALLRCPPF